MKPPASPTIRHALKKARTAMEAPAPIEADGEPAGEDDTVVVPCAGSGGKTAKGKKSI